VTFGRGGRAWPLTIRHPDGSLETTRIVNLQVGSTARVQ
jgi:hypothetical protein